MYINVRDRTIWDSFDRHGGRDYCVSFDPTGNRDRPIDFKAWFSYVGKIADDRAGILLFPNHPRFCRYIGYSPEVCSRFSRNDTLICDRETGAQQFRGLVMCEIHRRRTPTGMIADHGRNLGRVGKIEMLPILQICPRSSQTIRDI